MTQDVIINSALALLDRVERQESALRVALEALKVSLFDVSEETIQQRHEAVEKVMEALE
jgi:predicted nucleic acid-binding protein